VYINRIIQKVSTTIESVFPKIRPFYFEESLHCVSKAKTKMSFNISVNESNNDISHVK